MRILKSKSGWTVYSDGTRNESPSNLVIINPMDVMDPIDFGKITEWKTFCHIEIASLTPRAGLVGCSDLLIVDHDNGIAHLWIIGCRDSEIKYQAKLDINYEFCNESYEVKIIECKFGHITALFVNGEQAWPEQEV